MTLTFPKVRLNEVNWGVVISLVIVLLFWGTLVFAQDVPSAEDVEAGMEAQGMAMGTASTGCIRGIDSAVTIFQPNLDKLSREQLEVHERIHRQQIAENMRQDKSRDCFEAFWMLTASPMANLLSEVPAYRAQAQWLSENTQGFDPDRFYEYWAKNLFFAYSKRLDYEYILGFLQSGEAPHLTEMPSGLILPQS